MWKKIAALSLAFWLVACGEPVPQDHKSYVGDWRAAQMSLLITADGRVAYKRLSGGGSRSIEAPIKSYDAECSPWVSGSSIPISRCRSRLIGMAASGKWWWMAWS